MFSKHTVYHSEKFCQ